MKAKKKICGVVLSKTNKLKPEIRSALTWLDIKINDLLDKCSDKNYLDSRNVIEDFSEIMGVLKFLHMSEIITIEEYKSIIKHITSEDFLKEEVCYD